MLGLLGDGWFYVSAAGFIISAVFFVFLLGQYRAAVEAEDDAVEGETASEPVPLSPVPAAKVYTPGGAVAVAEKPAPVEAPAPVEKPASKAATLPPPDPSLQTTPVAKENTTGGLSPAVVYLQNMKTQMERLDKDISGLKSMAAQQGQHTDLILKRLAELADKVSAISDAQQALAEGAFAAASAPAPAAAPVPAPEPKPAAKAVEVPKPAPVVVEEPTPVEVKPEPVRTIDLGEPAAETPKPEKKAKKTVVVPEDAAADKTLVIEPTVKPVAKGEDIPLPPKPTAADPAAAPTIELSPPAGAGEAPAESPKPARKGPVWPI